MNRPRALVFALLGVAYVSVFALQVLLTRSYLTVPQPGGNDLYPRWAGGCLWLSQGANPYDPSTTLAIQEGIYGRRALPEEDQAAFAYPIYAVAFTWPLCLTTDFSVARAVWTTALVHMLLIGTILACRLVSWRPSRWLWVGVLAWAALVYPNVRAVVLGQMSIVVFLLIILALTALRDGRDRLAGGLLALSTIKPQMILLVIPWLLLWSAAQRRSKVVFSFAVTLLLLVALPAIVLPSWPSDFLSQLKDYTSYTELGSVSWIITTYYLKLPGVLEWVVTAAFVAWAGWEWYRSRRFGFRAMLWTTSLSLVLTHFIAPRTATTHFALLMLPLFLWFSLRSQTGAGGHDRAPAIVMSIVFVGTWWLFLATVQGRQESAITYLPIPLALAALLPFIRKPWLRLSREAV